MRIVVCDTGPILHLREAGTLAILAKAGEVLIPPGVNREMTVHEPEWPLVKTRLPAMSSPKLHWPSSADQQSAPGVHAGRVPGLIKYFSNLIMNLIGFSDQGE